MCIQTSVTGTITVNPDASIALTSAAGTDTPTVCINTPITAITYLIGGGGTGASISSTLPAGVTGGLSGNVFTIIGTPTTSGSYGYTVTTTGSCAQDSVMGIITVNPNANIVLTSAVGTDTQKVCINQPITAISYSVSGGGMSATISNTLPLGVTGGFSGGVFTISGTPTIAGTYDYTVTTSGLCIQTSVTGTITVNPDATLGLTSATGTDNQSVCNGSAIAPISYAIGGGATGLIINPALPSGLIGSPSPGAYAIGGTPVSIGTYNYTITTTGLCAQTFTIGSITVNPDASIGSVSGRSPLCLGNTTTYTVSSVVLGGGVGAWSSDNITIATVDTTSGLVTGVSSGTCNIIYTITGGCGIAGTISSPQLITITPNMSVGVVSGESTLCIGGTTTYSISSAVLSGGVGVWSSDDITIATVDATTGLVTGVSSGTCHIVYTVSGGCGSTVFASQLITINPDASVTSVNGTTPLCIGGVSTYTANAAVVSGGSGGWTSSDITIATVDAVTGLVTGVATGTCNIIYTIAGGCGVGTPSQYQTVTISPNASAGTVIGASPLCIGNTATYSVSPLVLSGGIGAWVSGSPARATIDVVTGLVTGVSAGNSNIIYTITGGCGGTVSSPPQVVTISPNASVLALTGLPNAVCIGGTTTYAPFAEVLSGGIAVWSSTNIAVASVDQIGVVTGVSAGVSNILYTITGGCGGPVQLPRQITVQPNASITLTSPVKTDSQVVCINTPIATITYTVGGSGGTPAITPALPTGLSTSFISGVYTISGTPAVFGVFNHTIITTGVCAPDTALVSFTINPTPVMSNTSAKTICSGLAVNFPLTTTGVPSTYSWIATNNTDVTGESFSNPSANTVIDDTLTNNTTSITAVTYTVIPTSIAGVCIGAAQTITITINPTPSLNSIVTSSVVCSGVSINYSATSATAGASFAWSRPAVNGISQSSNLGVGNITESLNDTTINPVNVTYTIITTANNCSNTGENITLTIAPVSIASPASQTVCSGTTTLIKLTSPVNGTTFNWTALEDGVSGATDGANSNFISNTLINIRTTSGTATYTVIPSYTVTTSSSACAGKPVMVSVTVNPIVIANAGTDALITYGKSITLGGSPTGPSGSTYVWSPSLELDDVTLSNPSASPKYKMVYSVVVTNIINGLGCSGRDSVEINVTTPVTPVNGFTPNGDGVNDTWDIDFLGGYPSATVEVFNRWGEVVFQSSPGYKTKWNGTYNGGLLPVGTYYYIINLNDPLHPEVYTGPVTIMR